MRESSIFSMYADEAERAIFYQNLSLKHPCLAKYGAFFRAEKKTIGEIASILYEMVPVVL
jgi:hypothetical protein